jgi:hypothetical protein
VSFSCRIRECFYSWTIRFEHVFFIDKQFRTCANAFPNEFTVRSYEYCACQHCNFTGYKKIKQRRISFVLGYVCMTLWKISTAISIKHRILATFNNKKFNSDSLYTFKINHFCNAVQRYISHLVHTTRFWNKLHQVRSNSNDRNTK